MIGFENKDYFKPVLNTAKEILNTQNKSDIVTMLNNAEISVLQTSYDNWNGGINYYTVYIDVCVPKFVSIDVDSVEKDIESALNTAIRHTDSEVFSQVIIAPKSNSKIDWTVIDLSKQELLKQIDFLKNTMISVSTGGQRIQNVEQQYDQSYNEVNQQLKKLDVENPNNYDSLWSWYGKWSNDFLHYQERRDYINEMYSQLIKVLSDAEESRLVDIKVNLTGWDKINRAIVEINRREKQAQTEEQFQAVGMLCRELIITLAQAVYDSEKHLSVDDVAISKTDAKRMLDAYIAIVLAGNESEELRAYAKATNKLANTLTHKRTATKKEMMLCTSATLALINFIGVLENKI
jgi:RNAse (barnase) inhibitor barstar